ALQQAQRRDRPRAGRATRRARAVRGGLFVSHQPFPRAGTLAGERRPARAPPRVTRGALRIGDGTFPPGPPFPPPAGAPPAGDLRPGLACVSDADLRASLLGKLPERVGRGVAAHLEPCPDCEAAARRLDQLTDPLIRGLRRVIDPPSPAGKSTVLAGEM